MSERISKTYVSHLPDLMTEDDYKSADHQKRIRIQLKITDEGIEIIGDSSYPFLLDNLLEGLAPHDIQMMLCG